MDIINKGGHDLTRRKAILLAATLPVFGGLAAAQAQSGAEFPQRVLTMIVPFAAGGSTDVLARLVAEGMGKHLGKQVIVENVPGAGGQIAGRRVLAAPADGYTILIGNTGTLAANAGFYKAKPFDVPTDFTALASVADAPQIVIARKDLPVSNLDEFVSFARANQAKMTHGAAGVGSGSFLGGAVLNAGLGLKVQVANYRGSGAILNDIVGGNIDYMVESSTAALPHILAGSARGVAVLQKTRLKAAPDIPAAGESRFPDVNYRIWNALVVHRQTPAAIVERLSDSIRKTLAEPDFVQRISQLGLELPEERQQTPAGAADLLRTEQAHWLPMISGLGLTLD